MENSEGYKPPEIEINPNQQESLNRQLEKLDQSRSDHQVFASVLKTVYEKSESIDEHFLKNTNIHYLPRCANKDTNTSTIVGDYTGSYEYRDIFEAVNDVPDPYGIFPLIENFLNTSKDLSNSEITRNIAEIINNNTDIPVIIEPFEDKKSKLYGKLDNGNLYLHCGSPGNYGVHYNQVKPSQELLTNLEKNDYKYTDLSLSEFKKSYINEGHFILLNESLIDDPIEIRTCVHELGHVVEEEYFLDKDSEETEVISSLYGLKIGMMMASIDQSKSKDIIFGQLTLYNWVLTGTVAP